MAKRVTGCEAFGVSSGDEALAFLRNTNDNISVIVMDIILKFQVETVAGADVHVVDGQHVGLRALRLHRTERLDSGSLRRGRGSLPAPLQPY